MYNTFRKDTLSTNDAARLLGYSNDYISKMCRSGALQAEQIDGTWAISLENLEAFRQRHWQRLERVRQKASRQLKSVSTSKKTTFALRRQLVSGLAVAVFLLSGLFAYGTYVVSPQNHGAEIAAAGSVSSFFEWIGDTIASLFSPRLVEAPIENSKPQEEKRFTFISTSTDASIKNTYVTYLTENPVSYVTVTGNVTQDFVRESLDSLRDDLNDTIDDGGGGGGSSGPADITAESIEDLADVSSMTKSYGDFLFWDGSSWANLATSSLQIALSDVVGVLAATKGGTGQVTYTIGDLLYADTTSTLARLPAGGSGQVLKISGGIPSWGADATGSGGTGAFATSSDDLSLYPTDASDVVIIGASATSTAGNIFEVVGNVLFRNALTNYGLVTAPRFTATSSTASVFPYASTTALSTAYASSTALYAGNLTLNTETFTDLTGTGLQNVGGALTLNATGDWTGMFDGQEGSYYLSRTNHTGTQAASTISDFSSAARTLLSSTATGLTYTSGTGVFSLTSGYNIPFTASTTEWNTAYLSRITSATYPLQLAGNVLSLAFATTTANTWNAQNTFSGIFATNASSTNATSSSLYVTGLSTGGVAVDTTGRLYGAATTTFSSPLVFGAGNVTITQASTGANGYLSSTDFNTFNNKISSTSLSAGTGISYVSATGVITNTGVTSLAGTANQITASGATGAVTLSLPSLVALPNAFTATYGTTTYASSTAFSALSAAFGATATTTITSAGSIGIGSSSPIAKFAVQGNSVYDGFQYSAVFASGNTNGAGLLLTGNQTYDGRNWQVTALGSGNTVLGNVGGFSITDRTANVSRMTIDPSGNVGFGTTTPQWRLTATKDTAPQLTLTDGSATASPFNFRAINNSFYISTSSPTTFATTSVPFLTLNNTTGSTTLLKLDITGAATTTSANGFNITAGCFAVNGTCVGGGGGAVSSVSNADGTLTISPTTGTVVASLNLSNANTWSALQQFSRASSTQLSAYSAYIGGTATTTFTSAGFVGVGSSTPWAQFSVNPTSANGAAPAFVIGSSTATSFLVTNAGGAYLGLTSGITGNGGLRFQLGGTSFGESSGALARFTSDNDGSYLILNKSRGTSVADYAIVQNGDTLGRLQFRGSTGTTTRAAAHILSLVDGVPDSVNGLLPGAISFATSLATDIFPVERARITSTGFLGIGSSTPWAQFSVNPTSANGAAPSFAIGSSTATRFVVTNAGNVGIGTTSPQGKLHVSGGNIVLDNNRAIQFTGIAGDIRSLVSYSASDVQTFGTANNNWAANGFDMTFTSARSAGGAADEAFLFNTSNNLGATDEVFDIQDAGTSILTVLGNGSVGIGENTPNNKLTVSVDGQSNALIAARGTGNSFEWGHTNTAGYGSTLGDQVGNGVPFLAFNGAAGTTNNTYQTRGIKASVFASDLVGGFTWSNTASANADNQTLTTLMALSSSGLVTITGTGDNQNYLALNSGGNSRLTIGTDASANVLLRTGNSVDLRLGVGADHLTIKSTGNVGIGTTSPSGKFSIQTATDAVEALLLENAAGMHVLQVDTLNTSNNIFSVASSTGTSYLDITSGGKVGIGTSSPSNTLTVNGSVCITQGAGTGNVACGSTVGNIYYKTANSANYDVAENYLTAGILEAGTIVGLDTGAPATLKTAVSSRLMLGAISSNPGLLLGGSDTERLNTSFSPLALSGRVPVKVNLEGGPIQIGDAIALSHTPGIGMKATTTMEVIGIALAPYTGTGTTTIEVFMKSEYWFAPKDKDALAEILRVTASTTPMSGSFMDGFMKNVLARVNTWMASASNGIDTLFAKEVHTDTICIKKADGTELCLSGDELQTLMANASGSSGGGSNPPPPPDGDSGTTTPDTTETTASPAEGGDAPPVSPADSTPQPDPTAALTPIGDAGGVLPPADAPAPTL